MKYSSTEPANSRIAHDFVEPAYSKKRVAISFCRVRQYGN